jgi:hypothetical protein
MKTENDEMHVDLMFPSKYLKAADFQGKDVKLTVVSVSLEPLKDSKGGEKMKYIVAFKETDKLYVLCKTTANQIAESLNEKKAVKWAGRQITLYPTQCDAFGKIVDCIRARTGK